MTTYKDSKGKKEAFPGRKSASEDKTTDPLFMKIGSQYYFYHNDHLGTPQKITSVNGAVVWSAKYSSFGKADVDITSTITNNLRFPGQYFDQETGLYYNWHRYYEPGIGRFGRSDPSHHYNTCKSIVPFLLFDLLLSPQELSNYSYVVNNPVTKLDPFGLYNTSNCDSYEFFFDSKFEDGQEDKYPKNAYECCKDFIQKYKGSKSVNCVAECLTEKEADCQEDKCPPERAKCRRKAHSNCYLKCRFIPYRLFPMSCMKIITGN